MTVHTVRSRGARPAPLILEHSVEFQTERGGSEEFCDSVRRSALRQSGCLSFHVRYDRRNLNRIDLLSEWSSREALNRWVRTSGVLWLERGMLPPIHGVWSIVEPAPGSSREGMRERVATREGCI